MKKILQLYSTISFTALPFLAAGQTPLQTFGVNFSNGSGSSPQNWNEITTFAAGSIGDLQNLQEQSSGYAMEVTDGFNGAWVSGLSTGNDSGPVPDAVMATFWYNQHDQGILKFTLDETKKYTFRFYGGRDGSNDDKSSDYTIGAATATLYNWNNVSNTVEIDNVRPDGNGNVFVSVEASDGYAYAILNGIIIEEYPIVSAPAAPSGLTATASTADAIDLTWTDNSDNESGFEVERSVAHGTGYSVVHTTVADVDSYTDSDLNANTTYYYRIRAVNAAGNSAYAQEASATTLPESPVPGGTLVQTFGIDFSNTDTPSLPNWNTTSKRYAGAVLSGLKNMDQQATTYAMEVTDDFNGSWVSGLSTGNDSGPVPDEVMATFWYNEWNQGVIKFTLDKSKEYKFIIYGGRDGSNDDKSSDYTTGGTTVTLYNWNNLYNSVTIEGVAPDGNNEVFLSVKATAGYAYALLNGIIIEEYTVEQEEPATYVPLADLVQNRPNDETSPSP